MLIINNYEEFASHLGQVLGTSEWLEVPQERINLFADATLDHQWIHVDAEKGKKRSFRSNHRAWLPHSFFAPTLVERDYRSA